MSADDQQFLDVLSSLPGHLSKYTNEVADFIDQNVEKAASYARETLSTTPWVKDYIKFKPPPVAPPPPAIPQTTLERAQDWVSRHKLLTGAIVVVFGFGAYYMYRESRLYRKTRRARRARNGGRVEVVVVAGNPALPLTRSLSLDMERRGFVVFVVCNAAEDESLVHNMSRPDIRPLTIDISNPPNASVSIERFAQYLQTAHAPAPRIRPNHLNLKSVILIPSLDYQTSPIATIPPSSFADLFNTHLLQPILTIQAFLPLLTARLSPAGEQPSPPKVLVLTPSIISSINPPFHAPEATICSALTAFTEVLAAELRPLSIPVTHMQLGTFDFTSFTPAGRQQHHGSAHHHHHLRPTPGQGLLPGPDHDATETLSWPEGARSAYGRNFVAQSTSSLSAGRIRGLRGSSLRTLHHAVFDVLDGSVTSATVRVGLGAGVYGLVGRWAPRRAVAWMMGVRRVDELTAWQARAVEEGGAGGFDGAGSDDGGSSAADFVAVPPLENAGDDNVWKEG